MRILRALATAALLIGTLAAPPAPMARAAPVTGLAPTSMWTLFDGVRVRDKPGGGVLTTLDLDQEVRVTGITVGPDGFHWDRVRMWGAFDGWILARLLSTAPTPRPLGTGVPIAPAPVGPHSPMPLHARAIAVTTATLRDEPSANGRAVRLLATGALLTITRWATDGSGRAWYGLAGSEPRWLDAEHAQLLPVGHQANLAPIRGTGMWLTPPVLQTASPESIVAAARHSGITHLYAEVAGSRGWGTGGGFYGAATLDKLLPVAHRAHIAVLAWVYPFLDDVPSDVAFSVAAARYVTPTGDRPDGLSADVEQNMEEPYVRAYSQVLRARLGPRYLMTIATYPPQTIWGKIYPFRTAAHSWDAIVPMDYWNVSRHPYTETEAYQYVAESIRGIQRATGDPHTPIEVLGQMYDAFGDGMHSPTTAEIRGSLRAARDLHAIGISFFEWNHATPGEWDALQPAPAGRS